MFTIKEDLSIHATRGDIVYFSVTADDDGVPYKFQAGDVLRLTVVKKKDYASIVMEKDFGVVAETETVDMFLSSEDTKIGKAISKPTDYWYEVVLNPDTMPQTIIGHDETGAKVFKLYPEGGD